MTQGKKLFSSFVIGAILLFANNDANAQSLRLKNNPQASGNHILVGDLFENAGARADYALAIAPKANQKTTFNVEALQSRINGLGLKWQAPNNMRTLTIEGNSANQYTPSSNLIVNNKDESAPNAINEYPVLNRNIMRDETITFDMINYQKPNGLIASNTIIDAASIIGMRAKNPISANQAIHFNDIAPANLVKRGEQILLVHQINGLKITLQGKSLDDGIMGSKIRVVNLQSNKTIDAIVNGTGSANAIGASSQNLASR
jgi:flagella basal body P-ring formation protein FlgA